MTEIKLEVGKRYPTRNGGYQYLNSYLASHSQGVRLRFFSDEGIFYNPDGSNNHGPDFDIIGPAIEDKPKKIKDLLHPKARTLGFIDPRERAVEYGQYIAGEEDMSEPTGKYGNKTKPVEPSSNPLQLQPGDVLTDKEGREYQVVYGISNPSGTLKNGLVIVPKPKPLSGFMNVYDGVDENDDYVESAENKAQADRFATREYREKRKRIACIDLSQFEEGYGL